MRGEMKLFENETKVITVSLIVYPGRALVMKLQEWDKEGDALTFVMMQSWGPTVAREDVKRATQPVKNAFVSRWLPEAKKLVSERVEAMGYGRTVEASPC